LVEATGPLALRVVTVGYLKVGYPKIDAGGHILAPDRDRGYETGKLLWRAKDLLQSVLKSKLAGEGAFAVAFERCQLARHFVDFGEGVCGERRRYKPRHVANCRSDATSRTPAGDRAGQKAAAHEDTLPLVESIWGHSKDLGKWPAIAFQTDHDTKKLE
jgi:hypothetical protein